MNIVVEVFIISSYSINDLLLLLNRSFFIWILLFTVMFQQVVSLQSIKFFWYCYLMLHAYMYRLIQK